MQRVPDVYRPEKLGGDVFAVGVLALGLNGIDPPALTTALRLPDNTRVVHLGRVDRKVIEHQDRQRRTERGKQSRGQEVRPLCLPGGASVACGRRLRPRTGFR